MKSTERLSRADITSDIKNRIKGKTAVVGIGNILRGDDGLGPKLIESLRGEKINAVLFDCGTAPENYILPILSTSADTIIFVDAADFGAPPGDIKILDADKISLASFSTHSPSPRLFIDLLKTGRDDLNIFFIAIQPKSAVLGENLSEETRSSVEFLKAILVEIFK